MGKYTYLTVIFLSFVPPLLYMLIHRHKRQRIKLLMLGCLISSLPFIAWDIFATGRHWHFNQSLIWGGKLLGIPIEEYLFLVFIPFACLTLWDAARQCKSLADILKILTHHLVKN